MISLPPLVDPGPPLDRIQTQRYARHLLMPTIGEVGQRRLLASHVAVLGAGGLGSPALLYLAAAGVGHLTIIDDDDVDLSNLQRQVIHPHTAVGSPKVDSAAMAVTALNPDIEVTTHRVHFSRDNAAQLVGDADLVLDGTDNFDTRYAVNDACAALGKPYVWGSVYRTQAQVSVFWSSPPPPFDPVDLRDLFPTPPAPGTVPSCADAGVLGALTGQIGSMMAGEAIKLICGIGTPLVGTVAFCDLLEASVTHVTLRPRDRSHDDVPEPATDTAGESSAIPLVSPRELADELASPAPPTVLDVREPAEVAICAIEGSVRVPLGDLLAEPLGLPLDANIVVHCKAQPRSEMAYAALRDADFTRVRVLAGGIAAWARDVDPTMVRY